MVVKQEGDRIQEDHGEQTVITPPSLDNPHNFGPASARDEIVWTCERPGGDPGKDARIDTQTKVDEWMTFMTAPERKIQHVFILMAESEMEVYDPPGLIQAYQDAGMIVHHTPYNGEKSFRVIMEQLDQVASKNERAVAHCTHGMGRSGRVAAGWLVHKYGLTVDQAVEEALDAARKAGVERMGSPQQLAAWMAASNSM